MERNTSPRKEKKKGFNLFLKKWQQIQEEKNSVWVKKVFTHEIF